MTQEQKTIKLAEFEGYKSCSKQFYGGVETWRIGNGPALLPESLPKYFEDLNTVHNLEPKLTADEYWKYVELLVKIVREKFVPYVADRSSATAEQRAEAIGQTLKLW